MGSEKDCQLPLGSLILNSVSLPSKTSNKIGTVEESDRTASR
ncbi:hypothetical protein UO65_4940 [Actinokineospora spheciospongiae]|uniref:Uncharacterized protein n=1 Tax=Actinokineospora spheciospongiae TaxID=909613 RepID=W7ISS1_9PSEU|nr:hypothetical protein UO65_4940 [Actinokineospora spheciospongiae]